MGLTVKNLNDMTRVVEAAVENHSKKFGGKLSKKEMTKMVDKAIEAARLKWLEGQFTDHSISELYTLKDAIKSYDTDKDK